MTNPRAYLLPALAAALVTGCASVPPASPAAARDTFFENLTALCGKAYEGRIVADTPPPTSSDPFAGKTLVMHVRECDGNRIRIPFHVGEDRSRTWVITRTDGAAGPGLRLKHDHRHADGSDDKVTMYGGDTATAGTTTRQEFPVDVESTTMFTREGMTVSNSNTWAMEVVPARVFAYELSRPGGRLFRVEFDLTRPVPAPPAPWGATD